MIEWLISVYERCRDLAAKANDAKDRLLVGEDDAAKTINGYMKQDYDALIRLWKEVDPEMKNTGRLSDMARHVRFGMNNDYEDIVVHDIPSVLNAAEALARDGSKNAGAMGFEGLLHPAIVASSLSQYRNGHLRDAVLNGVIAVFDMIRATPWVGGPRGGSGRRGADRPRARDRPGDPAPRPLRKALTRP